MNTTRINTRKMASNAILIAVGAILHLVTPPFLGMQPDLSLAMLFIIIVFNKDYKTAIICGLIVGVFAAQTTKTLNGQIPNIMDKLITANIVYLILLPLRQKISQLKQMALILSVGTVISGSIFVTLLMKINGMPFTIETIGAFSSTVILAAVANVILGIVLFKIVDKTAALTGAYALKQ